MRCTLAAYQRQALASNLAVFHAGPELQPSAVPCSASPLTHAVPDGRYESLEGLTHCTWKADADGFVAKQKTQEVRVEDVLGGAARKEVL